MKKQFLFMCGTPRSGTTFMARLVGAHPDIVMGVERFARRYADRSLQPGHFERERFFDLRSEDTRHTEDTVFYRKRDALAGKFASARFVGDKYPSLTKQFTWLRDAFGEPVFIFVLRNPVDVARSWAARARDPGDRWPEVNGFRAALGAWNRAVTAASSQKQRGCRIVVLDYDLAVAGGGPADGHLDGVFERIGASPSAEVRRLLKVRARRAPRPGASDGERAAVRQLVDGNTWARFDRLLRAESLARPAWMEALAS